MNNFLVFAENRIEGENAHTVSCASVDFRLMCRADTLETFINKKRRKNEDAKE